jgi:4'-phosphopantetheinyl transferase
VVWQSKPQTGILFSKVTPFWGIASLNYLVEGSRRYELRDKPERLTLGNREVQVWHYDLDVDAELENSFVSLLSAEEKNRANRFHFPDHRRLFIARRGILRIILSQYTGCEPEAIHFKQGEFGKPYLASPNSHEQIRFSATSSSNLGGVAITRCGDVGMDLEQVLPDTDQKEIASSQFSLEEHDWLRLQPAFNHPEAFYKIWTCKEAYLKGKGLGITVSLKDFAISINGERASLAWSNIDPKDTQRWSFHQLVTEPGFIGCLAFNPDTPAQNH